MTTQAIPAGGVRAFGDRGVLIGVTDAIAARALVSQLERELVEQSSNGTCEVVGGLNTVLVTFAEPELAAAHSVLIEELAGRRPPPPPIDDRAGTPLEIPVVFDGPDLVQVAEMAGGTIDAVIEMMTARTLTVAMLGFSPGFAFLEGLPEPLSALPRRPQPRPTVPAGSVALANGYAAVYPSGSPGGWNLVGRTDLAMFSTTAPPYARLHPGQLVQFAPASGDERVALPADRVAAWDPPPKARSFFRISAPGLRTVLQDRGRVGMAHLGVPAAGPADPHSFALANRLVGNAPESAALEITARGPTMEVLAEGYATVVGGAPEIRLDGQAIEPGRVFPFHQGQVLAVGNVHRGLRTYLAVAGGFAGPRVLGSVTSDQLSGLGPGIVEAGDTLWVNQMTPPLGSHLEDPGVRTAARHSVPLRVIPGPHDEWFDADALERMAAATFRVEPESNRVGLRLRADSPVSLRSTAAAKWELASAGMVDGAIQLPPDQNPVVLLPDHATHGGYPVVGVVASVDHGLLGQCAPGDAVHFVPITLAEARELAAEQQRAHSRAVISHYPLMVE